MKRRAPVLRFLALLWATLQVASAPMSAVADGLLVRESGASPVAHVESSTTSGCPVVHPPDCGMCRYLSGCWALPEAPTAVLVVALGAGWSLAEPVLSGASALVLPDGRAPPVT